MESSMSVSILSGFPFPIGLNPISTEYTYTEYIYIARVILNSFITQMYQTINLFLTINS